MDTPPHLLARAMACHAGRYELRAFASADPDRDPLRPTGGPAKVSVEEDGDALIVRIKSSNPDVAEEILERARALATRKD